MRWLGLTLVAALGMAQANGPKEAQALYEAMEAKLTGAEALRVTFKVRQGIEGKARTLSGVAWLAKNGFELNAKGSEADGSPYVAGFVSDGEQLGVWRLERGEERRAREALSPELGARFVRCFAERAVFAPEVLLKGGAETTLSNFSWGTTLEQQGRTLQIVLCDLTLGEQPQGRMALSIDTQTQLPVERRLMNAEGAVILVEQYVGLQLGDAVPARTFAIPWREGEATPPAPKADPETARKIEALYAGMEAKILEAKTLRVRFTVRMNTAGGGPLITGELILGEGNRVALDAVGKLKDAEIRWRIVCDGERLLSEQSSPQGTQRQELAPPADLGARFRACFARFSVYAPGFLLSPAGAAKTLKVQRHGPSPWVVHPKTGQVSFQLLTVAGERVLGNVIVFVDPKTQLPVKRALYTKNTDQPQAVEAYERIEIDGEVAEETFVIPAEGK